MSEKFFLGFLLFAALGCAVSAGPTTAPTSRPATQPTTAPAGQVFQDPAGLVRLEYSTNFAPQHDPDYVLSIASGDQTFTLDIPDLPPHIPNLIPLGLVVNGYKDDLKKSHPDIKIDEETAPDVPHAQARELRSKWDENHVSTSEIALLLVHGDHVFILRIVAPADHLNAASAVFDGIVRSLQFLK